MTDKENQSYNIDFSLINKVLSFSATNLLSPSPIPQKHKSKSPNHLHSKSRYSMQSQSYIQILNNLWECRNQLSNLRFSAKLEIAKVIVSIVRFFVLSKKDKEVLDKMLSSIIKNSTYLLIRIGEISILVEYTYYLIEYFIGNDQEQLAMRCEYMKSYCDIIKKNQTRLEHRSLPEISITIRQQWNELIKKLIYEICRIIIDIQPVSQECLDFLEYLVISNTYQQYEVVRSVLIKKLDPSRLPHLISICISFPLPHLKQIIYCTLRKIYTNEASISYILQIIQSCIDLFLQDTRCEKNIKIIQYIVQTSVKLQFIPPIEILVSKWRESNKSTLYYVCKLYLHTTNSQGNLYECCCEIQPLFTQLNSVENYKYIIYQVSKYFQKTQTKLFKRYGSLERILNIIKEIDEKDSQKQNRNLPIVLTYITLLDMLKDKENEEKIMSLKVDASFVSLVETLLVVHKNSLIPKYSEIEGCLQAISLSQLKNKNISAFYGILLILVAKIKGTYINRQKMTLLKKIVANLLQGCQVDIGQHMRDIFNQLKKQIVDKEDTTLNGISKYLYNCVQNGYTSTVGSTVARIMILAKIFPKHKVPSQLPILDQLSQSHFFNTIQSEMLMTLQTILFNPKCSQSVESELTKFINIFEFYRQYLLPKLQQSSVCYVHYYEIVSYFINNLNKLSCYYSKKKIDMNFLHQIINKLKLSLIMQDKYSSFDMFNRMDDNFKTYFIHDYVNIYAKLIHLIATNCGQPQLSISTEGQYEEFCSKASNIIKKLQKFAAYLKENIKITETFGIKNLILLPIGKINYPKTLTTYQFKSLMANLDTIIYYSELLDQKNLQTFVGFKVSLILVHREDKSYQQLDQDTKLKVLSQMLPLVRRIKPYEHWVREQLCHIKVQSSESKHLLHVIRTYLSDSKKIQNNNQNSNDRQARITLLKACNFQNQSVVYGKQVLRQLIINIISKVRSAYEEAVESNLFSITRFPLIDKISRPLLFQSIDNFKDQPRQFQSQIFTNDEMFDYDKIFCHIFTKHFLRLTNLMFRKNQLFELKSISEFGMKIIIKSFNLSGCLEVMSYKFRQYEIDRIFDSTLRVLKQIGINTQKLEDIRIKVFDRAKSMACSYKIANLVENFKDLLSENTSFQPIIVRHFVKTIMRSFGCKNYIDQLVTQIQIDKIFKDGQNTYLEQVFNHLQKKKILSFNEAKTLTKYMLSMILVYTNQDYQKALQYKNALGKIHSSFNDQLLSVQQILEIGFNTLQLNYIYKQRILIQSKIKDYISSSQLWQQIQRNDERFKIQSIQKNIKTMVETLKKTQYPFVMMFIFGDKLVVCTITSKITIKAVDINKFMDTYKETKLIIKENNTKIQKPLSKTQWFGMRIKLQKRLENNIKALSRIQGLNFLEDIFDNNLTKPNNNVRHEVLLLLEDSLQNAPYQYMNDEDPKKGVYRVPSLSYVFTSIRKTKGLAINMARLTYLVDPENNLSLTQQRFKQMHKKYQTWQGIIAEKPNTQQFLKLLKSEVFMFMGHGQGKYIEDYELYENTTNTIPLLYGCSSVRMVEDDTEAHGFALTYLLSGCPLLLGCLWNVTDKDVDEFTSEMIKKFRDNRIDLGKVVSQGKRRCKLKYLNGAAIILYGLPHTFCFIE